MELVKRYRVLIEQADDNWSAYSPNLPGCITTGPTYGQTLLYMREAIDFPIEGLQQYGYPVPPSSVPASQAQPITSGNKAV